MDSKNNRVALVTGANKGIGFESARQLGQAGVMVLLAARASLLGQAAASILRTEGLDVHSQKTKIRPFVCSLSCGLGSIANPFRGQTFGKTRSFGIGEYLSRKDESI